MRTIKFRGKRAKDGQWIYGYYLVNRGEHFIVPEEVIDPFATYEDYLVDPDTTGQFTGAYDRNGQEIYEGDILRSGIYNYEYEVCWDSDNHSWYFTDPSDLKNYEIVGNIHDNPELLTK